MVFRFETTDQAHREADAILEWLWSQHSGDAGVRWFLGLEDAVASLSTYPERCPLAPENTRFPFQLRQLLYGHNPHVFRILFTIQEETVYVLHIRHGRRRRLE